MDSGQTFSSSWASATSLVGNLLGFPAWLAVALGGAFGALSRWQLSLWAQSSFGLSAPWSIAGINGMGGLLIGICLALSTDGILQGNWRLLLVTGFLGGFTTFSTFSVDLLQYLRDGAFKSFFLLACVSNGGGLLAAAVGFFGFRAIFR